MFSKVRLRVIPIISVLRRLRQEDCLELNTGLGYGLSEFLASLG